MAPPRQVPLAEILTAVEQRWHAVLAGQGRRLDVRGDDANLGQSAPATLAQILDVLVDNATTHGRGTVTVTTASTLGGTTIDVGDEGDGVPAPAKTFAEQARCGPAEHGLGMPLARSLAEAAGGRLVVKHRGPKPVIGVILPAPAAVQH
jgi:signal transduction histidine kinase